jgi:hypothetical protein
MADGKVSISEVLHSAGNKVEYSGNNCSCCARLKQELKSAITEWEFRKFREVDIRDAIEVMSSTKSMQKKCSENDLPFSEKYQFQEQRNRLSDKISKTCNGINEDSVILMGENDRDIILCNCMEVADNPIPVIVNGEIVSKN